MPVRKIDHGYCVSMYLKTPDGLRLEFTVDAPDAEQIAAMRRKDAHSELARWLAGDRASTTAIGHTEARGYITRSLSPAACFTKRSGVSKSKFM